MLDLLHGLIKKPISYLAKKLSARQFLILSAILVGLTSGLAAVSVKYVVHSINQLVTFYSTNYEEFFLFALFPTIGNWSVPCRSHYWIERSRVRWSHAMSTFEIDRVRQRDRAAVEYQARPSMRAQTPAITPPTQQSRPTTSFWQRLRRFLGI